MGIIILGAGIFLVGIANAHLLKNKTSVRAFDKPNALVTSGAFSFSRNPIYLGMTLILCSIAIYLGSLSAFIFPVVFFVIVDQSIIPGEERGLEQIFGITYNSYRSRTRRWL
jgi:protein-S-isoprenylcysteine O-methyltransferase Ste14